MFPGHQQQRFETHLADHLTFTVNLFQRQHLRLISCVRGETAIGTVIRAQVGQIEWQIHVDGIAETLAGQFLRQLGHRQQIFFGGR